MIWAVGMTTAPRRRPTLARSLASLHAAGWEQPRIFAEPGVELPAPYAMLPISRRDVTLGAFPNWFLGLSELIMRHPHAGAYLMFQDDVLLAEGLRAYLEAHLWPAPDVGVVSIYCPSHYGRGKPWGFHREDRGWHTWGALAYAFPNPSARALISDRQVVDHRHNGPRGGDKNIDSVVGAWCARVRLPYFVHVPSLAEHIGETSTIYAHAGTRGRRHANKFVQRVDDR